MPMPVEAFQEDCRRLLTEKDYALTQRLWAPDENDFSGTGNRVLDAWLFSTGDSATNWPGIAPIISTKIP